MADYTGLACGLETAFPEIQLSTENLSQVVIHRPNLSYEENITELFKSFTQLHPRRMK